MAEENKEVSESLPNYDEQMTSTKSDPSAVEWQNENEAKIAEAVKPEELLEHIKNATAADSLLGKIQGAYKTNGITLTQIAAISQYVMDPASGISPCTNRCSTPGADPCLRKTWNLALIRAFRKTKDSYIQTFLLDQLRWCACNRRLEEIKALKASAADKEVRKFIDVVVTNI